MAEGRLKQQWLTTCPDIRQRTFERGPGLRREIVDRLLPMPCASCHGLLLPSRIHVNWCSQRSLSDSHSFDTFLSRIRAASASSRRPWYPSLSESWPAAFLVLAVLAAGAMSENMLDFLKELMPQRLKIGATQ